MVDGYFMARYRRHAANCFKRVGRLQVVDGCLQDGPPMRGCDTGESLHRLATRTQPAVPPAVILGLMR